MIHSCTPKMITLTKQQKKTSKNYQHFLLCRLNILLVGDMVNQRLATTDLEVGTFVGQITARAPRNAVFKLVASLTSPTIGYRAWKHRSQFQFQHQQWTPYLMYQDYVGLMWSHFFDWPLISEWYMVRLVVKNGHQKDMRYDDLKLCGQNLNSILG